MYKDAKFLGAKVSAPSWYHVFRSGDQYQVYLPYKSFKLNRLINSRVHFVLVFFSLNKMQAMQDEC